MENTGRFMRENIEIGPWIDIETYNSYKKEHDHYTREISKSSLWKKILITYMTAWTIGASAYLGVSYLKYENGIGPLANTGIEWTKETQKDSLGFMASMFGLATLVMYLNAAKIYGRLHFSEKSSRFKIESLEKKMYEP